MRRRSSLALEQVKDRFSYDAETGVITRKDSGKIATFFNDRYLKVSVPGSTAHGAHRIAWLLHYGEWPDRLDHINGDCCDNRIANLRKATQSENCCNAAGWSACGYKGVSRNGSRWQARIIVGGEKIHLGTFDAPEAAHAAYADAASRLNGKFATLRHRALGSRVRAQDLRPDLFGGGITTVADAPREATAVPPSRTASRGV